MKSEEFKYQEQWDKHDYSAVENQLRPKDAYSFGYQDAVEEIREWLEEEIITRYDWSTGAPMEDGIDCNYPDKWKFLDAFFNKFQKQ